MALEGVVDPISLEPLLSLPYAPFELRADPSLVCTDNDWFDGHVLSHYLVSTGTFLHPISRRELTRDECASLDSYLVQHKVGEPRVLYSFDHRNDYDSDPAMAMRGSASIRIMQLRDEANRVLLHLFAGASAQSAETTQQRANAQLRAQRQTHGASAVAADGNMRMIDDDEFRHEQPRSSSPLTRATSPGGQAHSADSQPSVHTAAACPAPPQHVQPAAAAAEGWAVVAARGTGRLSRSVAGLNPTGSHAKQAAGRPALPSCKAQPSTLAGPSTIGAGQCCVSRTPATEVPAAKSKGQKKAAAKQRKAAAVAIEREGAKEDEGVNDGREERDCGHTVDPGASWRGKQPQAVQQHMEGLPATPSAAEVAPPCTKSTRWAALPPAPESVQEAKARHRSLLLKLRHQLCSRANASEAQSTEGAIDWFRAESSAFASGDGGIDAAQRYVNVFLDLFGVEGAAPCLLELAALLPTETSQASLCMVLKELWGLSGAGTTATAPAQRQPDSAPPSMAHTVRAACIPPAKPRPAKCPGPRQATNRPCGRDQVKGPQSEPAAARKTSGGAAYSAATSRDQVAAPAPQPVSEARQTLRLDVPSGVSPGATAAARAAFAQFAAEEANIAAALARCGR